MDKDKLKLLEERVAVLDFKLELALKLSKFNIELTLENCKNMDELAFFIGLQKKEFIRLNELLATQITFYKEYKSNTYLGSRLYSKLEEDLNVFVALSREEFEAKIGEIVPKLKDNRDVCFIIAKITGIQELYYEPLADEIKKAKFERLDKETKLLTSYKENKPEIDGLFKELGSVTEELDDNIAHIDKIIEFFDKNELYKISIFYNGELWEISDDDKKVVINEDTYIHNVCTVEKNGIFEKLTNILKDKQCQYHDLIVHLLKSGPTSSNKLEALQTFYKKMANYNTNDYILKTEIIDLKGEIEANIKIVKEILTTYQNYLKEIKK